jgi:hypothetical protein
MWDIVQGCWDPVPMSRPNMREVHASPGSLTTRLGSSSNLHGNSSNAPHIVCSIALQAEASTDEQLQIH